MGLESIPRGLELLAGEICELIDTEPARFLVSSIKGVDAFHVLLEYLETLLHLRGILVDSSVLDHPPLMPLLHGWPFPEAARSSQRSQSPFDEVNCSTSNSVLLRENHLLFLAAQVFLS